jgi:hypothetical protein
MASGDRGFGRHVCVLQILPRWIPGAAAMSAPDFGEEQRPAPDVSREELLARLTELREAQERATGWGAAVGARHEEIMAIERRLAAPPRSDAESVEEIAKIIYSVMPFDGTGPFKPEWIPGGNSFRQDEARYAARAILSLYQPQASAMREAALSVLDKRLGSYAEQQANDGLTAFGKHGYLVTKNIRDELEIALAALSPSVAVERQTSVNPDEADPTFAAMVNAARDEHFRLKGFHPYTADIIAMLKAALSLSRPHHSTQTGE